MIYFIADTHLNCEGLVDATRPEFSSCAEHDEALIYNINRRVERGDTLYILGDFCYKKPGRWRPRIRCNQVHFILGNHDQETKIRAVFGGNVWQQRMVKRPLIYLSHYPTAFWPQSHYGALHLYGHTHNCPMREAQMDLGMPGRRSMDVGVDAARKVLGSYEPFSLGEVELLIGGREGHDIIERKTR